MRFSEREKLAEAAYEKFIPELRQGGGNWDKNSFMAGYSLALEASKEGLGKDKWIPIKTRTLTEEEKEEYPEKYYIYDCQLPDEDERVLISLNGSVYVDKFIFYDDGFEFDDICSMDADAWMPLPEPYEAEQDLLVRSQLTLSMRIDDLEEKIGVFNDFEETVKGLASATKTMSDAVNELSTIVMNIIEVNREVDKIEP